MFELRLLLDYMTLMCLFAAYSLDEVDQKTRTLRASAGYTIEDDASSLDVRLTGHPCNYLLCTCFFT